MVSWFVTSRNTEPLLALSRKSSARGWQAMFTIVNTVLVYQRTWPKYVPCKSLTTQMHH